MMFTGPEIADQLTRLSISHVIWVPDSDLGQWEADLESAKDIRLVRICREGEAWPLAAGLLMGGQSPVVVMQTTGLFESGDALRNVAHDLKLPVFALIGARNWLTSHTKDSARKFARPILRAWGIEYVTIESRCEQSRLAEHYWRCRERHIPGIVVLAE
jgi:sulfopyruvate decarboxylase TPP-binding subunit